MNDPFELSRFVEAQGPVYEQATRELQTAKKASHWMWMQSRFLCLTLAALIACVMWPAAAGQRDFRLERKGDNWTFHYAIEDRSSKLQRLSFSLPDRTLRAAEERFQAYDPEALRREGEAEHESQVRAAVAELATQYPEVKFSVSGEGTIAWEVGPPRGFADRVKAIYQGYLGTAIAALRSEFPQVRITESDDGQIRMEGRDGAAVRRVQERLSQAEAEARRRAADHADQVKTQVERELAEIRGRLKQELEAIRGRLEGYRRDWFRDRLYVLGDAGRLLPDYRRIAHLAADDLAPVGTALRRWTKGLDKRETLGRLLVFVQSIPFDPLGDRAKSAGVLVPVSVLRQNRGDCDSKAVTYAALAHLLFADLPISMVLTKGHAYLGLGLPPRSGDQQIRRDGRTWTVAEPVGPRLTRVGELGPDSQSKPSAIMGVVPLFP